MLANRVEARVHLRNGVIASDASRVIGHDMIEVAGAIIEANGERQVGAWCLPGFAWRPGSVLIARRGPDKRHPGQWELPGGKLEPGETGAECLARELAEELGIAVTVGAYLGTNVHDYGGGPIALQAWRCHWDTGALVPADHDAFAWVPRERLMEFDWVAADVPLVEQLIAEPRG